MAASRRRYFLLDEVVPAAEASNMMGRLVEDIFLPLRSYAPSTPVDGKPPTCRPQDILPNILPEPTTATTRKAMLEGLPTKELHIALTDLFGLDFARGHSDAAEIEGKDVKQYSLNQSKAVFEHLMNNAQYEAEAIKLLKHSPKKRAFLVTGFITTASVKIQRKSGRRAEHGFSISLPVSSAFGGPSALDPKFAPSISHETSTSQESVLQDECIFAIAYDTIVLKHRFDTQAPKFVRNSVENRGMKRAKPQQLAMGRDDGSDEEIDEEEEEEDDDGDEGQTVAGTAASDDALEWAGKLENSTSA